MIKEVIYLGINVGYARLSRDDGDDESSSIFNQKRIIIEFAKQHGIHIDKFYIDDGVSGYTMDRPDFDRLKIALNNDEVDIIIVKNLSRLGRRNSMVQLFLENIEESGKRVIAIDDNYDTWNESSHETVGITTWINERYVKDTSKNVRRAIDIMQKEGRYVSNVPYGYELDLFNKGSYHIDETCAMYVKEIFDLYLSGYGVLYIARLFTERGVPNSTMITKQRMERRGQTYKGKISYKWAPNVILNMLRNDFYIGTLTLGKTKRRTINGKRIFQPEENLIRFENAHEPIIDKQTFKLVQEMIIERSRDNYRGQKDRKRPNIFAGKLYCSTCDVKMTSGGGTRNSSNTKYICKTYNIYGKTHCTSHIVSENELKDTLVYFLEHCRENLSEAIIDLDKIIKRDCSKKTGDVIEDLEKNLAKAENEVKALLEQKIKDMIANPSMSDIIDKTYSNMVNEKYNEIKILTTQVDDKRKEILSGNEIRKDLNNALEIFDNIISTKNITKKQIATIVDHIVVHEDGGVDIFLKGDLHELCTNYIMCKKTNKTLVVDATIKYIKKNPEQVMISKAGDYVRLCGHHISRTNYEKIFKNFIEKGYLVENEGYHNGYRVVDLNKLIHDAENNIIIDDAPRVHNNNVNIALIIKIQKWISSIYYKKKILF